MYVVKFHKAQKDYVRDEDLKSKITLSNNYTWAHIYVCKQTAETCVLLKKNMFLYDAMGISFVSSIHLYKAVRYT